MIPAEAVEAAASVMLDKLYSDKTLKVDDEDRDIMLAALEAAAPYMLAHEREQTRLAHLDAMVNRETASRLEQAIAGVLELAAPQRHMVSAAEIREWVTNALEGER